MVFKPDEVTTLKKGSHVYVEITEEDIRILKRNFCGVYELYKFENDREVEYFDDLILFKNKYGSTQRKFALYNLRSQRNDIYTLTDNMDIKDIFKWFSDYGDVETLNTVKIDSIVITTYRWLSDIGDNICYFTIAITQLGFKLNIIQNKRKFA